MHDAPPPPLDRQGIGRFTLSEPPLSALTSTSTMPCAGGYAACQKTFGRLSSVAMSHPLSQPVGSGAAPRLASGAALPRVLTSVPAGLAVAVRLSFSRYLFTSRRAEVVLFLVAGLGMIAGGVMLLREPDQMVHSD